MQTTKPPKAVVLLSGGLDSTTALYWTLEQGYAPHAMIIDYSQRHRRELRHALKIARHLKIDYHIVQFDLPWSHSALTDRTVKLPKKRNAAEMNQGIPASYVPARNTLFISFALSYADAVKAQAIVIGANAIDYSGYPDCRPKYLRAMEKVAQLGTESGDQGQKIKILAPLVRLTKAQIIRLGMKLEVPYLWTWSCYAGQNRPCRECDSCILREKGFNEAGLRDPANRY